eukprot:TRINITY_DN621_c0_g1_i3.p1 TRINITY_DN621_c0_g1~~TRINITY_DN621_c0_g1_i3.p1  ORF type:complete len:212 (-),score=39.72 TRINITY_DN621_c0_g1_i3:1381-2016(-)
MKLNVFGVVFICCISTSLAAFGVDLSTKFSVDNFKCLKQNGKSFAVVRVGQSTGHVDPHGRSNIINAKAAGFEVDGYIFPCPTCGNAAKQINQTLEAIKGSGYGTLWLDIEGPQYWTKNRETNRKFLEELIDATKKSQVKVAIYSSASQWNPIFGADYKGGHDLPLWYAHYDFKPTFSDFKPFAGWTKPVWKQYKGTTTLCGVGVDLNYRP